MSRRSFPTFAFGAATVVALTACNGPTDLSNHSGSAIVPAASPRHQRLYVGDQGAAQITVYSTGSTDSLVGTIPDVFNPFVAMSPGQQLYSSYQNRTNSVMTFTSRSLKLLDTYTTNIKHPTQIVFDSSGNAYFEDKTYVVAYPNGKPTDSYKIHTRVKFPQSLATAPNGDLYIATPRDVEVVKPGKRFPSQRFAVGNGYQHIAIGASGNLYVADTAGLSCGSVIIFKLGHSKPSYAIGGTKAACSFGAIAEGPDGNIYVATEAEGADTGTINVYSSGNPTLLRSLSGLQLPLCLGFDNQGNLYVGDADESVVNVYAPGSSTASSSISNGIDRPISLTFSR